MKSQILSDQEIRKYSQQIQLPGIGLSGQEKIKKSRILVIGAGGKGASVLQGFVSTGVGYLGICDNFIVEDAALPRQRLYGDSDIGKQKAIISRQRLRELSRMSSFELHNICLSESNIFPIIKNYDILVDATDNFQAHYLINDAAVKAAKPVVFGSVYHNTFMVSVFNYLTGHSLRDLYPVTPQDSNEYTDEGITASNLLYDLAGNFMVHETLKIILGVEPVLSSKVLSFRLNDYSLSVENIP